MSGLSAVITVFPALSAVNIADGLVVPDICSIVPTDGSEESHIRFLFSVKSVAIMLCCPCSIVRVSGIIWNSSTLFLTVTLHFVVSVTPSGLVHESVTSTGVFAGVSFLATIVAYCPLGLTVIYSFESSEGSHLN